MTITPIQSAISTNIVAGGSASAAGNVIGTGNIVIGYVTWHTSAPPGLAAIGPIIAFPSGTPVTVVASLIDAGGSTQLLLAFVYRSVIPGDQGFFVSVTGAVTAPRLAWTEYSSSDISGIDVQAVKSNTSTTAPDSGTIAPLFNGDLIWACAASIFSALPTTLGPGAGFTTETTTLATDAEFMMSEIQTQATAAPIDPAFVASPAEAFLVITLALSPPVAPVPLALFGASVM